MFEISFRTCKNILTKFRISFKPPHMHPTIMAHYETLQGTLVGMKAGVNRNQSASWLESARNGPQQV